eukprot:1143959-Pelagomonas_calceolata.AAC.1
MPLGTCSKCFCQAEFGVGLSLDGSGSSSIASADLDGTTDVARAVPPTVPQGGTGTQPSGPAVYATNTVPDAVGASAARKGHNALSLRQVHLHLPKRCCGELLLASILPSTSIQQIGLMGSQFQANESPQEPPACMRRGI